MSAQTVSHWRTRLARQGFEGLREMARPGRPRRIGQSQRLELLALACEPAQAQGRATPTLDELVERAVERGVVKQISHCPQFRQKANGICALYRQAPKGSVAVGR